ncbi:hypothetical protein PHET_11204 [Paragonimus heterotremus]|uniref:Uncharacterized protein n=1 Tax=Paragonimus heterotremus TaxID=100268 RepID=A0A8J4T1D0_9TREM|nr:hypothetical protein PHET_11204 [Paragonimus heterotremus]
MDQNSLIRTYRNAYAGLYTRLGERVVCILILIEFTWHFDLCLETQTVVVMARKALMMRIPSRPPYQQRQLNCATRYLPMKNL